MKSIVFLGDTLDTLRGFPDTVRRNAGFQLDRVQRGLNPDDWKPLSTVGQGVRELRVRDASGAFRVVYLASQEDGVYVLHVFQKKTRRTSRQDIALARQRYQELLNSRRTS
jgi:phage-related protein